MAPTANSVKASGDISLSDAVVSPTSPSKPESVGYNLRSGLKAIFTTPALKHPIPDISLSDASIEGSGLYDNESSTVSESVSENLEKAKKTTEKAISPVMNKAEAALDSARQSAASTADDAKSTADSARRNVASAVDDAKSTAENARRNAASAVDAAKSTASSALHTVETKTAETYAYAKRKAEESLDYAKHVAGDGVKYAKQKTGLGDESVSSKAREGVEEVKNEARKGVANVSQNVQEATKPARPPSPVKSPIVHEHAGVLEALAGSAKNVAEKFSNVVHHPLGGAAPLSTGAPTSTPTASFPAKSPTKSAPSTRVTEIPTTSGQKVPIVEEDVLLG